MSSLLNPSSGLARLLRFARALALIAMLGGCEKPAIPEAFVGPTAPSEEKPLSVEVVPDRTMKSEFARARTSLKANYREFLERQELAFDSTTLEDLGPAVATAWHQATEAIDPGSEAATFRSALPLFVIALMLIALLLLDRQAWRLASRAHARAHAASWSWIRVWLRLLAAIAGRAAPAVLLLAFSYFPVQAVFGRAPWTHGLSALLWLLLVYRTVMSFTTAAFAFELFEVSDEHANRLLDFARRSLRLLVGALSAVAVADQVTIAEDVRALLGFAAELAVLAVPIYLLFIKSSVLAVFPEPEGGFYERFHAVIARYFRAIVVWSAFLLALRAVGYVYAATFILLRGYGLLVLVFLVVASGIRIRRWLHKRESLDEEHLHLVRSIEWALRVIALLAILYAGLRLLLVWEPLVIMLEVPLVSVGGATISAFSVFNSALLFLGAILLSRFVRAILVLRVFPALEVDVGVAYAVQTLVNYAMVVVGFFIALVTLGVNLSAMTVVIASLGVGIGFGLQTLTENLISGFILLFGRSVKKGDVVSVGDAYGQVHAVGARSVLIRTSDNYDMLIPSKEIVGGRIINWSYSDTLIRLRVPVGVTYNCKPREVEKVLLAAAKEHPLVLPEPAPEVWLTGFGDSSVNFLLLIYFDCMKITRDRLNGQLNFIVWDALAEAGIEIPFPQRDLHLKSIAFPHEFAPPAAPRPESMSGTEPGSPTPLAPRPPKAT